MRPPRWAAGSIRRRRCASTKIDGFSGFEEWNRKGSSEAVVLLGDRLIVKASARGMGEGAVRKVVEAMDPSGLAKKGT